MKRIPSLLLALLLSLLVLVPPSGAVISSSEHVTGTWTFTSAPKIGAINEAVAGEGVTIDGLLIRDGVVRSTEETDWCGNATCAEYGDGVIHRTVATVAYTLTVTDAGAAGAHGSVKLYTFPEGAIRVIGASSNLTATCDADGLTATATNEIGIGSAAAGTDNAALTSTEEDIITGSASDLVASVETLKAQNVTGVGLDGTTTPVPVWLNFVFAADDASATDTCAIAGTVTLVWVNAGDY